MGAVATAGAATTTVHIFNFDFSENMSGSPIVDPVIDLGDTVHWVWDNGFHSTTSVAGIAESWDSGVLNGASHPTFDHTFTNVGTFWYYCSVHGVDNGDGTAGMMAGTVTVRAVPEPTSMVALGFGAIGLLLRRKRK